MDSALRGDGSVGLPGVAIVIGSAVAEARAAVVGAQLAANAVWTPIFFGARRPALALADLAALLALLAAYTSQAAKSDRPAAGLFAPYIAWVLFAGVLNFEIVRLNPEM
jgi:Tryptophan-rich sensory protein (mitochondrial benzodiazepine receptor homolog)